MFQQNQHYQPHTQEENPKIPLTLAFSDEEKKKKILMESDFLIELSSQFSQ